MKISYNWLKSLIDIKQNPEEIAQLLTDCGLEVESIEKFESVQGGLKGMVIGKVLEREKHPDADRLSLTKVDIGMGEPLSIVCGAPNVAAGQKVVVATVGAKLFPTNGEPFEIKKSKIRGALSEGMICAEDEIGLGDSHDGIMILEEEAKIGQEAGTYFNVQSDYVFEIGLTPNRSDAASHIGVARDLVALFNAKSNSSHIKLKTLSLTELPPSSGTMEVKIQVNNSKLCPRYSGVTLTGVKVSDSPDWLKSRLKSIGLKPINNIVDVTNFVLHETGQPLHAFDAFKIKDHQIVVRTANKDEKFTTLDGIERTLKGDELMICDSEQPLCMAGIFGGISSGVSANTVAVFLESAFFESGSIRKSSKIHGLKTDASFRFERGTDPEMVPYALNLATSLILEIAGGQLSSEVKDVYPLKLEAKKVAFSYVNCSKLIGKELDRHAIKNILISLGISIVSEGSDGLLLEVPQFKTDVNREADVIEEILRIYGYNQVEESEKISYSFGANEKNLLLDLENKIGQFLSSNGYSEIMSTSLTKEIYYENENLTSLVKMLNPLSSDLNVLRQNLLFSGLEAIQYNLNRKNSELKVFEFGRVYSDMKTEGFPFHEEKKLSILLSGKLYPENSFGKNQPVNFYTLKNTVEKIIQIAGIESTQILESESREMSNLLEIKTKKQSLANLGEVSKSTLKKFGIEQPVFYAELHLENILHHYKKSNLLYKPVSKFPAVRRDLALLLDQSINYSEVEKIAFESERKLLKEVTLFDIYKGDKIEKGKKSYAIALHLQDEESTLTDKQIDLVMKKLIENFQKKLGAELRS